MVTTTGDPNLTQSRSAGPFRINAPLILRDPLSTLQINSPPQYRHNGRLLPSRRQEGRLSRSRHGRPRQHFRWCLPRYPRRQQGAAEAAGPPCPGWLQGRGGLHPEIPAVSGRRRPKSPAVKVTFRAVP